MIFKLFRNNKGGAAIAFILIAAASSFYLIKNTSSLMTILNKEKRKINITYITEKFSQGVFNYTVYAIKNRWCMDESWDRDYSCGQDMRGVVFNPLNLERLLWSETAIDAINESYKNIYNVSPSSSPGLKEVKISINVKNLEKLKVTHPLNLAIEPRLRSCIDKIDISISKYLITSNLPKGDEILLSIGVIAKKKKSRKCDHIQGDLELNSEVAFYPRTLNSFSLIKEGDLNLMKLTGAKSDYGIRFNSKVYIENDFYLPNSGFSPVGFYDSVYIGGGNIYKGSNLFSPKSSGGMKEQVYSQIETVQAINSGISYEQEVDPGLSPLFGKSFAYPKNTLLDKCIQRSKVKDNPFLTRNSRLFVKGGNGDYTLALSADNEFRDFEFYGQDSNDFSVQSITQNIGAGKNLKVDYTGVTKEDIPVFSIDIKLDGISVNPEKMLLTRNTNVEVKLIESLKYQVMKTSLEKDDVYLDFDADLAELGNYKDIRNKRNDLRSSCQTMISNYDGKSHENCKVVLESYFGEVDCDDGFLDKIICEARKNVIESKYDDYKDAKNDVVDDLNDIINDTPTLKIRTNDLYANQIKLKLDVDNGSTLDIELLKDLGGIELKLNAFDFAIEQTMNPITGKRTEDSHLPGPNEAINANIINIEFERSKFSSRFKGIKYKSANGTDITSSNGRGRYSGWVPLKKNIGDEPPKEDGKSIIPEMGVSTAEAKKIDEDCLGIFNVDSSEWDISFTDNTQFSWLINVTHSGITIKDPSKVTPIDSLVFTEDLMRAGNYKGIPNRSIVKECIVPSSINTVFGFYVCEKFTVESRNTRLTIIGTIVTSNLNIEKSAISKGVDFYSIWNPRAIDIMKSLGHLRKTDGSKCKFSRPGWSQTLSENEQRDLELCSPMRFIYEGVNNFNWTTIDPEIGIPADGSSVTTRSKIPNRYRRYVSKVLWVNSEVVK